MAANKVVITCAVTGAIHTGAAGAAQIPLATTAGQMGGNVRGGLEDSLFISRGKLARSNAEQVQKIRRIVEDLGSEVATPAEAREMLGLKGADRVGFGRLSTDVPIAVSLAPTQLRQRGDLCPPRRSRQVTESPPSTDIITPVM
jgi:hypothetical protein